MTRALSSCAGPGTARPARGGFTLIELLLATLLSGILTATTAVIVVQSVQMRSAVEAELAKRWERVGVLDAFANDAGAILRSFGDESEVIAFPSDGGRLIEMVTLADAPAGGRMFRRRLPARVAYTLEDSPDLPEVLRLVREIRYLTDPPSGRHRFTLAEGLRDAYVEVHDGAEWLRPEDGKRTTVAALGVRLTCEWWDSSGGPAQRTVVLGPSFGAGTLAPRR
jgi:prepilin-type N-terminal cleavage/methylation domain-containing protein